MGQSSTDNIAPAVASDNGTMAAERTTDGWRQMTAAELAHGSRSYLATEHHGPTC